MAAMMEVLIILILASAVAFVIAVGACYLSYVVPTAWSRSWKRVTATSSRWEADAEASERRARIEEELNQRNRKWTASGSVHAEVVEAAEMTKRIASALALLKDATLTCCDVQKFAAQAYGATDMQEVAWEPACANVRQYVMDGIDVALDTLGRYPLKDRKILKQHIGLGAIRATCEDCELLRYDVAEAPALCSPAKSLGNRTGEAAGQPKE